MKQKVKLIQITATADCLYGLDDQGNVWEYRLIDHYYHWSRTEQTGTWEGFKYVNIPLNEERSE